ncbi:unnamed protein product, partial [Brassica rapa subsp. narinosa]
NTTKTLLQAISGIQTGKQSTIAISSKDCVSSTLVHGLIALPKTEALVCLCSLIYISMQFIRHVKITGKKVTAGLIFASPLDATLQRRRSDRG